jgi:hypothetical protein
MCTAEESAGYLHSMSDDSALAVFANRGDGLDGAFKTIESMVYTGGDQFKTLVVLVATNFTFSHIKTSS